MGSCLADHLTTTRHFVAMVRSSRYSVKCRGSARERGFPYDSPQLSPSLLEALWSLKCLHLFKALREPQLFSLAVYYGSRCVQLPRRSSRVTLLLFNSDTPRVGSDVILLP